MEEAKDVTTKTAQSPEERLQIPKLEDFCEKIFNEHLKFRGNLFEHKWENRIVYGS